MMSERIFDNFYCDKPIRRYSDTPYLMSMILYSEDLPRKNDEFLQNNTLGEDL